MGPLVVCKRHAAHVGTKGEFLMGAVSSVPFFGGKGHAIPGKEQSLNSSWELPFLCHLAVHEGPKAEFLMGAASFAYAWVNVGHAALQWDQRLHS